MTTPDWLTPDDPRAAAIAEGRTSRSHVEQRRLGARLARDPKDWPAGRHIDLERREAVVPVPAWQYYYERFNQNQTGPTCVANTLYHLMGDAPAPTRSMTGLDGAGPGALLTNPSTGAQQQSMGYRSQTSGQAGWRGLVYDLAQLNDEWADTPPEGGTSGRAGCKVLKASGLISSYLWLHTAEEVALAILAGHGPVGIGALIYEGMYYVDDGDTWQASGAAIGGHEFLLSGYGRKRNEFRVQTWGMHFWLPYAVLDRIFSDGGDAFVVTDS